MFFSGSISARLGGGDGIIDDFESYDPGHTSDSGDVVSEGGPPDQSAWTLDFEDDFDGSSLDTNQWDIGFGWGTSTNNSYEEIREQNVWVDNSRLHLQVTHDGGTNSTYAGAVNSKGLNYYGPGSYWEAKIQALDRYGMLPAFWSKPNNEDWPPEIDFFEMLGNDPTQSTHNLHYSTSTTPGDESTHDTLHLSYDGVDNVATTEHIYGCAWHEDTVDMYVDGQHVGSHTDSTAMTALQNGAPFYMMLNVHVGKTGEPDYSEAWGETMTVDWVRTWTYDGGGSGGGGDLHIPAGWTGDGFTVTTVDPLEGQQSLLSTSEHSDLATDQLTTYRGEEWRCMVQFPQDQSKASFLTHVQDVSAPLQDCYWWQIQPEWDKLALHRRTGGSSTSLAGPYADTSIDPDTTYVLVARIHDDADNTLEIGLEDTAGNTVVPFESGTEADADAYDAGHFGFHTSHGKNERFDAIERATL